MDYTLLKEIIKHIEEFQQVSSGNRIEDFVIWLTTICFPGKHTDKRSAHGELLIAFKMMYLNKRIKKAD
ncbi:MAG: hypothetical protein R2788_23805 [Saprospiraceae bacterium]